MVNKVIWRLLEFCPEIRLIHLFLLKVTLPLFITGTGILIYQWYITLGLPNGIFFLCRKSLAQSYRHYALTWGSAIYIMFFYMWICFNIYMCTTWKKVPRVTQFIPNILYIQLYSDDVLVRFLWYKDQGTSLIMRLVIIFSEQKTKEICQLSYPGTIVHFWFSFSFLFSSTTSLAGYCRSVMKYPRRLSASNIATVLPLYLSKMYIQNENALLHTHLFGLLSRSTIETSIVVELE